VRKTIARPAVRRGGQERNKKIGSRAKNFLP